MSQVTNVLLCVGVDNWDLPGELSSGISFLNQRLYENHGQTLRSIDEDPTTQGGNQVGGSKHLEILVYAAGLNYVGPDILRDLVADAPWTSPDQVQLMTCGQEDHIFTVETATELQRRRFALR